MSNVKELTWQKHKEAENLSLMKALVKGEISDQLYADLLYTHYQIYGVIEDRISFQTPCLYRKASAFTDWQAITHQTPPMLTSFERYLDYLRTAPVYTLRSHVYVHYLALCYGGAMIAKVIGDRFPTSVYEFEDMDSAKEEVRRHMTVDMAAEANRAFEFTIDYYQELWNQHAGS